MKLLSKSVKIIYFTVPKKEQIPFDVARTRTLLYTLQRHESYRYTIDPLTYELIVKWYYNHVILNQYQACYKWMPPVH